MPDIKISSHRELFHFQSSTSRSGRPEHLPLKIAVLADLSGRPSASRPAPVLRRIDKDNFDSVFARLKVALNLPHHEQAVVFEEIEDLHPDYLYQKLPIFTRIEKFKQSLPKLSSAALSAELAALGIELDAPLETPEYSSEPSGLLDSVLDQQIQVPVSSSPFQTLIQDIVAPYTEDKRDPRVDELAAALDDLAGSLMRELLHSPAFRQCEASWRSLAWLNRVLDTDRENHLYALDLDAAGLAQEFSAEQTDLTETALFQLLVAQQNVAGGQPFDVIVLDTPLSADPESLRLLSAMGGIASAAGATLLADGRALLGGEHWFEHLEQKTSPPVLQPALADLWQTLRSQAYAAQMYLSAPGYMVRLPYGANTRSCDVLAFEELVDTIPTKSYLWGNGAYILCRVMSENRGLVESAGSSACRTVIEGLPVHVQNVHGESMVMPPAEVYLSDRQVASLNNLGFTALRSVLHRDALMVDAWCSLSSIE